MAGSTTLKRAGWTTSHAIKLHASFGKRGNQIAACVMVVTPGVRSSGHACGEGSNPRAALGVALTRLGKKISARQGTFAGYSRKNRRVRRTRRSAKRRG